MLDYLALAELLTPQERVAQQAARDLRTAAGGRSGGGGGGGGGAPRRFLEAEALPGIRDHWERGTFPAALVPRLGAQGMLGASLPPEHGGAGVSAVAYGLLMYELE